MKINVLFLTDLYENIGRKNQLYTYPDCIDIMMAY